MQEHVGLDAVRSGKPYSRLVRRMTVAEFARQPWPQVSATLLKLEMAVDPTRPLRRNRRFAQHDMIPLIHPFVHRIEDDKVAVA